VLPAGESIQIYQDIPAYIRDIQRLAEYRFVLIILAQDEEFWNNGVCSKV
jgi:hypothetical protein